MAELDGAWEVKRVGGALPPLVGVRKEISGASGCTRSPSSGFSFASRAMSKASEP